LSEWHSRLVVTLQTVQLGFDSRSQNSETKISPDFINNHSEDTDRTGMEAYRGGAHSCMWGHTKAYDNLSQITVILIQTRPAQHRSCLPGQVLHLWRAHSPPNRSLMRKLFKAPKHVRTHRLDSTTLSEEPARYPERNMVLSSPTLRCCTPPFAQ